MKLQYRPSRPASPNQRITCAPGTRAATPVRKDELGTAKEKRPVGTPLPAHLTPFGNLLRGSGDSVPDSLLLLSYRAIIGLVSRAGGRGCLRWCYGLDSGSGLGGYCLGSAADVGRREGCKVVRGCEEAAGGGRSRGLGLDGRAHARCAEGVSAGAVRPRRGRSADYPPGSLTRRPTPASRQGCHCPASIRRRTASHVDLRLTRAWIRTIWPVPSIRVQRWSPH